MKMTITETMFKDAFVKAGRKDQFSYEGLTALFGYIEELEEYGEELELDVIALCCDFSEHEDSWEAMGEIGQRGSMDKEECLEYLYDNTHVIEFDGGIIIQSF